MKPIQSLFLLCLCSAVSYGQSAHFGVSYSYGPTFNFHRLNEEPLMPSDCFAIGGFYHLETGEKSLGFRSSLSWRRYDFALPASSHTRMINEADYIELKIQCSLPISGRSSLALGMAPRLLHHASTSIEYRQRSGGSTQEFEQEVPIPIGIINGLNTSAGLSYYFRFSKHFSLAAHVDQDLLTYYSKDMSASDFGFQAETMLNARLTSICASLIYEVR